ncbi:hypothetical protein Aperf_G00000088707 [Anoplocephala perfoliata]
MTGLLLVFVLVLFVLYAIWPILVFFVLRLFLSRENDLTKAGEWAVITGATAGIGKAFAELLARKGLNIFLFSLSEDELKPVASEIEKKYKVKTKIFAADFGEDNFPYERLVSEVEGLSSISCLINNVGQMYLYPDDFATSQFLTPEFIEKIIRINVITLTTLTRLILPKMINDPLPVRGVNRFVINMGSISGIITTPYLAVYAATKAYVISLTRSLACELRDTCVRVQAFTPSAVATEMSKIKRTSLSIPSAETFVKSALSMIGVETIDFKFSFFFIKPARYFKSVRIETANLFLAITMHLLQS